MLMHRKTFVAAIFVAGLSVTGAWAATPADTIKTRQAEFKKLGRAMKGVNDELRKSSPNVAALRSNANAMAAVAGKVRGAFPRGTGPGAGVDTDARPVIWTNPGEFTKRMNVMVNATRGLQKAAASGDVARIKAAFPAVGGSCKGCHDTFRAD
jgi:cytochrome c556